MANFCRQCMLQIWGEDESDFEIVGIASPYADVQQKNIVLCEGCGYILVNVAGSCIDPNCKLHGIQNQANRKDRLEEEGIGL